MHDVLCVRVYLSACAVSTHVCTYTCVLLGVKASLLHMLSKESTSELHH